MKITQENLTFDAMVLYKYFSPADALPSSDKAELPLHVVK